MKKKEKTELYNVFINLIEMLIIVFLVLYFFVQFS